MYISRTPQFKQMQKQAHWGELPQLAHSGDWDESLMLSNT